jgi:hypothetical protein
MIFGPVSLWSSLAAITAVAIATAWVRVGDPVPRDRGRWLLGCGAFAVVLGASLLWVDRWAAIQPVWDELGDGLDLYQPFANGRYTWKQLFASWFEHRITLARLWALGSFALDGQWSNKVQAACNALINASGAALLLVLLARRLKAAETLVMAIVIVLPRALPLATQNVSWGFQSQFYFLLLYAPLALWALSADRLDWKPGLLGIACLLLSLFSVGSGALCALALLSVAMLEALALRGALRTRWPLMLIAAAVLGLGVWLQVVRSYPATFDNVVQSALSCAAYPFVDRRWLAPLMWLPSLSWLVWLVRQRRAWTQLERITLSFAALALLHALAIAWTRGWLGAIPPTRYYDLLAFGPVANTLAAIGLVRASPRRKAVLAFAAWVLIATGGTVLLHRRVMTVELQPWLAITGPETARGMRGYVETGDPGKLDFLPHAAILPMYDLTAMRRILDDPFVRSILPENARVPLSIEILDGGRRARVAASRFPWLRYPDTGELVRAPKESFVIDAPAPQSEAWWRAHAPIEVGRLSALTGSLGTAGRAFLIAGVVLMLSVLVVGPSSDTGD